MVSEAQRLAAELDKWHGLKGANTPFKVAADLLRSLEQERDGYREALRTIADENGAKICALEAEIKKPSFLEGIYEHFKARLIAELMVDVHGASHYGRLLERESSSNGSAKR